MLQIIRSLLGRGESWGNTISESMSIKKNISVRLILIMGINFTNPCTRIAFRFMRFTAC